MSGTEKKDLSLVSTDDLLEEMNNRYDSWIFSGMQIRTLREDEFVTTRKWRGNPAACMGLASQVQMIIHEHHQQWNENEEEEFFED